MFFAGCSATHTYDRTFDVPVERSDLVFKAALDELRERRFVPERIDSLAGIITTQAKPTGGLASLWDSEQSTFSQEVEDTFHYQSRTVRIIFAPVSPPGDLTPASRELFVSTAPVRCDVEAFISRRQAPLLQPQPRVLGLSSQAIDPVQSQRGMTGAYDVALARDDELAASIAASIARRVNQLP